MLGNVYEIERHKLPQRENTYTMTLLAVQMNFKFTITDLKQLGMSLIEEKPFSFDVLDYSFANGKVGFYASKSKGLYDNLSVD